MNNSIRWRLVMMYVLLVTIVMMVSGTMIILMISDRGEKDLQNEIKQDAIGIEESLYLGEIETIEQLNERLANYFKLNALQLNYDNKKIYILDDSKRVVYPPQEEGSNSKPFVNHQVMSAIADGVPLEPFGEVKNVPGSEETYIGYARGIKVNGSVAYVIYVLGSTESIRENRVDSIEIILITSGVALVIAASLGYVFSDFLTKPISALSTKVRDMQRGKLDQLMKVYSNDEIGQLTKNFNAMATSLNSTLNEVTSEKNKLEIVFKHMTDGILVFDKIGMMIHSNPASVHMLNIDKQISFQEVFKPYLDVSYKEMKDLVKDETISHMILVKDKYYSVYFAKFLDQKNEAVGLITVIQDITEHKKLEEMQKEFVANVSHELRTPLTTIKSYAETLLDGAMEDKEISERFLGVINHESDRMTALVQDLLELSKLDNSQVQFSMVDLNLEQIVEESTEKFRIQATKKGQSLIYHGPTTASVVVGDANRVEQVIKNIISNAVKYSQEGALVEVSLEEIKKYMKVTVSDNGMGISRDDLSRIFDRFFRVDKARSRAMGGTGLGLAIAKEIMEFHGGKIEVTSELNVGTTFDLYFPKKEVV